MARRNQHGDKRESTSLTWADVQHLHGQLQQHLGLRVELAMLSPDNAPAGKLFTIEVRAYSWDDAWGKPVHKATSFWPHPSCATLAGLMVRMMHSLDHMAWHQSELDGIRE